jgi:predicted unusual protein kinase regulating ubiquinone biosynthesis (AarF/ABC1/UbiB family)
VHRRRWASAAALATTAAAYVLAPADRRRQVGRQVRIWRLTARRAVQFAGVRVRAVRATDERRAALEERFAIRSAEDVAQVLGGMKGAAMKAGQMLSFLADGLPPQAQAALATLLADVPPMAPRLAAEVVRQELGADPERVFLEWGEVPVAAASIGQVHRAVTRDGRVVAVKVQYPGIDSAIRGDLDNAELLYTLFGALRLKNLDVRALVDELRARMADEVDYRLEAANQTEFGAIFRDHPFIHVPAVLPSLSTRRVLTSEWVGGKRWDEFLAGSSPPQRQRVAETIYRFSQGSVHRYGVFNGDPHPGNYRFHDDGSVTFLDFGLVKRWAPGEWDLLSPVLDAVLASDRAGTVAAMVAAGFLPADHGIAVERVWEYVSTPYVPLLTDRFRYNQAWVSQALQTLIDLPGRYSDLVALLDMPPSFVILDRVVWGVSGILGRLEAEAGWRGIVAEYRTGASPTSALGEEEARWRARRDADQLRSISSMRLPNGSST